MEEKHKTKIEFNSQKVGLIVVEDIRKSENEKSVIQNINSTMSVQAFPTAKLNLNASPQYPNLIAIKSGDSIRISISEKDKEYQSFFVGFILGVKIKSQKDEFELVIDCTSEFYKLQDKILNRKDLNSSNGLREILSQIVSLCNIKGEILLDESIDNDYELNHFRNFPAFSLINSICFELDLVYDFTKGDIMKISKRKDVLHKMFNSKPIEIEKDAIISTAFEQ